MKRLLVLFFMILALSACTEDYDAFGASDYRTLDELVFENQDGDVRIFSDEHKIQVTLVAPSDSFVWDSVKVKKIGVSHFASLHLVESKVRSFPPDSAKLDSIAKKVAYSKEKLSKGSKIRLPSSRMVYVIVVSESGKTAIWQIVFELQGGDVESSQESEDSGDDSENSGNAKSTSSSSSKKGSSSSSGKSKDSKAESSSSEAVLDSNVSFGIKFVDQLESREAGDTIHVILAHGADLSKLMVDTSEAFVFRKSSLDSNPTKVKDWSKVQKFVVTSESGASKTWYVDVSTLPSSEKFFEIIFKNELKSNRNGDTIVVRLKNGSDVGKASVASWSVSDGASISPKPDSVKSWSKLQKFEIVAEDGSKVKWYVTVVEAEADEVVSDEKELVSVTAKDEVRAATIDESKKTVVVHMKKPEDLAEVELSIKVSPSAYINLESKVDLRQPQKLIITAEDKSTAEWTVSGDYVKLSDAEILAFTLDNAANGFSAEVNLDAEKKTISFAVPFKYESKLSKVYFDAEYSEAARKGTPAEDFLDLSDGSAEIVVVAEDETEATWTVSVTVVETVSVPPRLLSMKIAGNTALIDSADEGGSRVFHVHYDNLTYLADLKNLVVSDIELTDGATGSGISEGNAFDLSRGLSVSVSNGEETAEYVVQAGYQYPGSDFNHWVKDAFDRKNDIDGWDNGNNDAISSTKTLTVNENEQIIKMESINATVFGIGRFASGNMFIGYFNPKGVGTLKLTGYNDGNELIDFGRPFSGRPRFVEFDVKYQGKGDSCDLYIILEHRSRTSNEGKNQYRTSSDVNTLIASAWYRATTVTSEDDPDVVSITDASRAGYKTVRLALKYGVPLAGSPIYKSSVFNKKLKNTNGIDNHMVQTESPDDFDVTHIRIVMASSALGNLYEGSVGATLWADEVRLFY
jgi:hypothetical protein